MKSFLKHINEVSFSQPGGSGLPRRYYRNPDEGGVVTGSAQAVGDASDAISTHGKVQQKYEQQGKITNQSSAARPSAPSTQTRSGARALGRAVTRVAAPVATAIDFGMAGNQIATKGDIYGAEQGQFADAERAGRVPGRGILDPLNQDSILQKAGTFVSRVGSSVADRIRSTAGGIVDDVKSGRIFAPGGLSRSMAKATIDNLSGVPDTLASGFSRGSSRELDNTQSTGSMREPDAAAQGKPLTMADRARLVAQRTGAGTRELEIRRERGAKAAEKATQSQPDRASESEIGRDPNNPDAPTEFRRQYKRDIPSPFDR